jgi:threonyl-tRNA synthetase
VLDFVISMLRDFGLDDFELELSMRDDEGSKWIGTQEFWDYSTNALRNVALASGLKLTEVPGEAAFYGPKIDLKTKDAIGRTWQLSTVQVDPNLPDRFDLEYTGPDGEKHRPIMIHRALFGSIERFFAILLEHYAGAFPMWLSPVQVVGIPVAEDYAPYLEDVIARLREREVRAEVDNSDDRMQKKIRTHTTAKVPVQLIVGEADRAGGTVSFRFRDGTQTNGVPVDEAIERIVAAIASHAQVSTAEDLA